MGYREPHYTVDVGGTEREKRVFLTSDFCVLDDEFFFIRCQLNLEVRGTDEDFAWGIWSSLSKENFLHYEKSYDEGYVGLGADVCLLIQPTASLS